MLPDVSAPAPVGMLTAKEPRETSSTKNSTLVASELTTNFNLIQAAATTATAEAVSVMEEAFAVQ